MKKIIAPITYIIALAVIFYALPLLIGNTGAAMLAMLVIMPLLTFLCAAALGVWKGFKLLTVAVTAIMFTPTVFIFYNSSAWIYIVIYAAAALAGNGIGSLFHKKD